jgi:hypothetical protein
MEEWMKKLGLVFLVLTAVSLAAQPRPDAQIAAMKKLDYMAGTWRGEGWIDFGRGKMTFTGSETIQRKLDGVALLVEGAFVDAAGKPSHTTLAVMSYDPAAKKYRFSTWLATGTSGVHDLTVNDNGWQWELATPYGTMRYVMTLTDAGEWLETGARSTDGKEWKQFFEMKLKK